jgi:hypothetical protein
MAARIPNTATRQAPRAKSRVKPKIEYLEAYTTSLSPKDCTPQITALCIGATAVGLALFGHIRNPSYLSPFGASGLSAILLTGLGVAIEALALGRPTLVTVLACRRDRHGATIAWGLWVPAVAMVPINSCGFSSQYIGDGVFAREQITDQTSATKDDESEDSAAGHS